jgi:MFS family permease
MEMMSALNLSPFAALRQMVDSAAAWLPGDSGIKPVKDAGRRQYWMYWRARGRRSGADHPDSSGTRGRGINHLGPIGLRRLLYALFFVSGVAQAAIVPLLPHLSARYGLSGAQTALLLALPGLAMLAVSLPSGVAADRLGAARVTLGAGVLLGASSLLQSMPSLAALLVGRVAFGVAFGVVWTTGVAWLADLDEGAGGPRLGAAITYSSVGTMAGPAIGGLLAQLAGVGVPFLVIAVVTMAIVAPLALGQGATARASVAAGSDADADAAAQPTDPPTGEWPAVSLSRPSGQTGSARAALRLARRPRVTAAGGGLMVSGAVSGVSQLLISSGLHHAGVSTGSIGLAFSAAAVGYIAVSAGVVRLGTRVHTLRFNALATTILALGMLPALFGAGAAGLVAALILTAAPRAAVSTVSYSLASGPDDGDAGRDGLVFGMLNGAWAAAMVLMPLVAGAVEQTGGARAGYLAVIIPSCAIAACLVAGSGRRRHDADGRRTLRARMRARVAGA